ncbi:MAG TPA: hypothetical protein DDY78_10495 [Planctomycetales bacterium]|nr:hypothetical protein [Planctomycetales bacterium]
MDLDWLFKGDRVLLARGAAGQGLVAYDDGLRPRLELLPQTASGYTRRAGQEYPTEGLLVKRVGEQ